MPGDEVNIMKFFICQADFEPVFLRIVTWKSSHGIADVFLRKWCKYLRNTGRPEFFHLSTLTITDQAGEFTILCTGVTPQKVPDRTFDRSSTNLTYTLLCANITEQ